MTLDLGNKTTYFSLFLTIGTYMFASFNYSNIGKRFNKIQKSGLKVPHPYL